MMGTVKIPLFPLGILPIPKELIPLHIFEPRYRQLLQDIQNNPDMFFGILFDHPLNKDQLGAIVKLESILKEYETGEIDIVVQCVSNFVLDKYYSRFDSKLYPAGEIIPVKNKKTPIASKTLKKHFEQYLCQRDEEEADKMWELHDIANMLHLEINDRMRYIKSFGDDKKENFLHRLIKYHNFIFEQEKKSNSSFHLN
ncbi:MAG: LON peptidase substrate-binding domain-containing protein [Candidatus Cyclobacteriaceae bacterium M2_1C_046]